MEVLGMDRGWVGNRCGPNRRVGHGYDNYPLCAVLESFENFPCAYSLRKGDLPGGFEACERSLHHILWWALVFRSGNLMELRQPPVPNFREREVLLLVSRRVDGDWELGNGHVD